MPTIEELEKLEKGIENTLREFSPKEVKISFKDTDRDPLIVKNPEEAYGVDQRFKYRDKEKEHWIHESLIAEVEITHQNRSEENVKSKK